MEEDRKLFLCIIGNMVEERTALNKPVGQLLAESLSLQGYRVEISSFRINKFLRMLDILTTIYKFRKRMDILIIQVYSGQGFLIAGLASWLARILHIKIVFHLHGGNLPIFFQKHINWVRRVFHRGCCFVCPSKYLFDALHCIGFESEIIPNFIDLSDYVFRQRDIVQPKLVWLRAFHLIYNPQMIPQVILSLRQRGALAEIWMAGPDKEDGSLKAMQFKAKELNVENFIHLEGKLDHHQVPGFLAKGDIFLNTTNVDNSPVSIVEAMASGLCVVSTNAGGLPYLLDDGIDALVVDTQDPQAMADAILSIISDYGLAHRLSANARKKAQFFEKQLILNRWKELLLRIDLLA